MTQTSDKTAGANRRIEFLFWIMAVAGCVVVLQLLNLQVLRHSFYREKAQKMHLSTVKQQVGRGTIFDRNGKKVAESISAGSVYICPPEIREKNRAAALLSRELDLPLHVVMKKINSRNGFEYIKRKIDFEKADKILSHGIRGIYAQTEQKRFYPLGRAAAHITGFSGMDNNGLEGTELYYEKLLRGKTGRLQIRRDAKQRPVIINTTDIKKAEKGADLYLTIDSQVQYSAQAELDAAAEKYRAKAGSIIVMNPNNGAIYAMANYPSYDPNNMEGFGPESRKNRAVTDIYEPGSTFKIFPMSLYIREFKDADSQKVFCGNGAYEFFGRTVHDHEKHGWLTFDEVIKYSSNIGMVNLGLKVPQEKLYREFVNFGFGRPTRIDMPHEPSGILRHYKEWDNISLTSIPYGQEVAVTPIQMARAYAVIANGGFLITPHIVERAEKNGKVIYRAGKEKPVRVLGEKECERLSRMLVGVTDKDGSGKKAVITGYTVAGKTGTAQKHNEKGRGYAAGRYVASFVGYLPAEKPEILTLVVLDEPKPFYYGSETAAPVFKQINTKAVAALRVMPENTYYASVTGRVEQARIEMPDITKKNFFEAKKILNSLKIKYRQYGFGKTVISQEPAAGSLVNEGPEAVVYLGDLTKDSEVRVYMPDVRGLPIRKAVEILSAMGIKAQCVGSGYAVGQDPKPGTAVEKDRKCVVNFEMKDAG